MSQRTNADIIRIVNKWQEAGFVHELTCRADSRHEALTPVEREGKVVLLCPTCGEAQEEIPALVLGSEALIDHSRAMLEREVRDRELRFARQDIWWGVVVIMACMSILPGLVGGAFPAIVGAGLGLLMSAAHVRRSRRKIAALADPASRP